MVGHWSAKVARKAKKILLHMLGLLGSEDGAEYVFLSDFQAGPVGICFLGPILSPDRQAQTSQRVSSLRKRLMECLNRLYPREKANVVVNRRGTLIALLHWWHIHS